MTGGTDERGLIKKEATGSGWLAWRVDRHTYQMDSPIGLHLKLAKIPPEDTLKLRRLGTALSGLSGVLLGPVLVALDPAL